MTLENPFFIYGNVDDGLIGIENVTVTIYNDTTDNQAQTTTSDNGYYYYNIQNFTSNGDVLKVSATYGSDSSSITQYTLDIDDRAKKIDLSITITITEDGDIEIYVGGMTDNEKIKSYCTRWDVSNYLLTVETFVDKDNANLIRENCNPGQYQRHDILTDHPQFTDLSLNNDNMIKIKPLSNLSDMREEKIIYVKSYGEHILSKNLLNIKIEGYISGSTL